MEKIEILLSEKKIQIENRKNQTKNTSSRVNSQSAQIPKCSYHTAAPFNTFSKTGRAVAFGN